MKGRCVQSDWNGDEYIDCKNKPYICREHYNKLDSDRWSIKKKLSNRNYLLTLVISLSVLILSVIWYLNTENIDENKFCLDKLNQNFPEYHFESAKLYDYEKCVGYYSINVKTRDGLSEIGITQKKEYKLINEIDRDYLSTDDFPVGVSGFLIIVSFAISFLTPYYWTKERGW